MDDAKMISETNKWLAKLEVDIKTAKIADEYRKQAAGVMQNINAYISDCKHFLAKKDYLNAYEAVIYAWGIWETCLRVGIIVKS